MKSAVILLFAFATVNAMAKTFVGEWTTIDDETKDKKSVVRIYQHDGRYFGRIVELFKNKDARAKLPGEPKIYGLDIIWNMKKDGDKLKGGKILDPKKGKVYSCEMWRDGDNLIVRGKIAFFGRNQTWLPYKREKPAEGSGAVLEPKVPVIR